jgi:hypothetical protein
MCTGRRFPKFGDVGGAATLARRYRSGPNRYARLALDLNAGRGLSNAVADGMRRSRGHPDGFWLPFAVHIEDLFGTKPHHTNGPGHPEYRDGEALIEWRLHFEREEREYIVVLRDAAYFSADGLEEDKAKVAAFKQKTGATGFILVANESPVSRNIPDESVFDGLIMDSDPIRAAERAYAALVGSTPTESVLPSK